MLLLDTARALNPGFGRALAAALATAAIVGAAPAVARSADSSIPKGAGALPAPDSDIAADAGGTVTAVWAARERTALLGADLAPGGTPTPPAAIVESSDGRQLELRDLEVRPEGTAYVLWEASIGGRVALGLATRPPGGAWSAPELVSETSDASGHIGQSSSAIAVAPDGVVIAIWCVQSSPAGDGISSLHSSTRTPAGAWSPRVEVGRREAKRCGDHGPGASIEVDAAGNVAALWGDGGPTVDSGQGRPPVVYTPPTAVYAAYRPAGEAWSPPQFVHRPPRGQGAGRALAFDHAGRAHIVAGTEVAGPTPSHAILTRTGLVSPPAPIPSRVTEMPGGRPRFNGPVDIAVDGTGAVVVVWEAHTRGDWTTLGDDSFVTLTAARAADGAWSSAVPLDAMDPAGPALGDRGRLLTADGSGNIAASWNDGFRRRGLKSRLRTFFEAVRPSGRGWGTRTLATARRGPDLGAPHTLFQPAFGAASFVAWEDEDDFVVAREPWREGTVAVRARVRRQPIRRVLRTGAVSVRCRASAAGVCRVRLRPTRRTARLVSNASGCLDLDASARVPGARFSKLAVDLHLTTLPCPGIARRLRRPGPDLVFTAVITADAPGLASRQITRRLRVIR